MPVSLVPSVSGFWYYGTVVSEHSYRFMPVSLLSAIHTSNYSSSNREGKDIAVTEVPPSFRVEHARRPVSAGLVRRRPCYLVCGVLSGNPAWIH